MNSLTKQSASTLLKNRQADQKIQRLAVDARPLNSEQALQIQYEMIKQRTDGVAGWKCLLPLNKEQLVVAPIFADTRQSGTHCGLFIDQGKARIEPEIAFVLGVDLPAKTTGYSESEIDNAVQSCHMALELMQDRFTEQTDVSFYEKLADCLVNQGLFIGPEIDRHKAYSAHQFIINITQNNDQQSFAGKHPNLLPQNPLYWLINEMSQRGISFEAGQAIITGSYAGVVQVDFNFPTTIEYVGLGEYQVTFNQI